MKPSNNELMNIIGYEIFDDEIKKKMETNNKVSAQVQNWVNNTVGRGHLNAVKKCYVKYMEYDVDVDDMDEFDKKDFIRQAKKNELECPAHKTCPMFQNNLLKEGMKCPIELAETQTQIELLAKELDIKPEETNDQILLSQLVGLNIIYNRGISGLSNSPLITEIRKVGKDGGVSFDTKVNENFAVVKSTLSAMEQLRKSLILNRDDKQKIKKAETAKNIEDVKESTIQMIKDKENDFDISSIVAEVIDVEEPQQKNVEEKTKQVKDIDC